MSKKTNIKKFVVRITNIDNFGFKTSKEYICNGRWEEKIKSGYDGRVYNCSGWDIDAPGQGWILVDEDLNVIEENMAYAPYEIEVRHFVETKIDLIVTRHPALVEYLKEIGLADDDVEVIEHATPDAVTGKNVCGVLPHSLSCLCESFTEVPLNLTPELRGKELDLDMIRKIAGDPVTYKVIKVK